MRKDSFGFLLSVFFLLFVVTINAQWVKTNYPPNGTVESISVCGNTILVGSQTGGVFISEDNGQTWAQKNNGLPNNLRAVPAVACSGSTFYATMVYYGFYVSTDGGNSWVASNNGLPNSPYVNSFAFSGNDFFLASGAGIYHSQDKGANWNAVNTGLTDLDVRTLGIIGQNIYAATYTDGLYKSSLNSISWTKVNNGLPDNDYARCFAEISSKIFVGTSDGVYYSDDNGATWHATNSGMEGDLVTSLAVSGNNLFAAIGSGNGGVMYSSDLGSSWHALNDGFPTYPYVTEIAVNSTHIFVGGPDNGSVWMRPLSQVTSVKDSDIPLEFKLSQNFPNPFGEASPSGNTRTSIKYIIPTLANSDFTTDTKLVVYDVLGREILTLVNKQQNSGEYQVDFDVSLLNKQIPSGIYFYRLQTGNFTQVKKMILLR